MSVFRKKKEEPMVDYSAMSRPGQTSSFSAPQSTPRPTPQPTPRQSTTFQAPKIDYSAMSRPGQTNPLLQKLQTSKQQQQFPEDQTTDITGINPLIAKAREIAQRRAQFQVDQANTKVGQLDEQQGINQKYTDARVAKLEGLRDAAIGRINATIPLQEEATNEYKTKVEDQYGRQFKESAQAQKEEQQGIQELFAGLNTIDSGALNTQAIKSRERLTGKHQEIIANRTMELNQADRELKQFKLDAQAMIQQEVAKFDDQLLSIAQTFEQGTAEYNAAIKQAYDAAQENIYALEAGLNERELAYEEKAQALQQEMMMEQMKTGAKDGKLTDKQALAQTGLQQVSDLVNYLVKDPNVYRDIMPWSNRSYKNVVTSVADLIGRMRSGGAINSDEEKRFKSLLPGIMDNSQDVQNKLQQLYQEFSNVLQRPDLQQEFTSPNSMNDPLGLLS